MISKGSQLIKLDPLCKCGTHNIPCEFQFNTSWYDSNQVYSSGTNNY